MHFTNYKWLSQLTGETYNNKIVSRYWRHFFDCDDLAWMPVGASTAFVIFFSETLETKARQTSSSRSKFHNNLWVSLSWRSKSLSIRKSASITNCPYIILLFNVFYLTQQILIGEFHIYYDLSKSSNFSFYLIGKPWLLLNWMSTYLWIMNQITQFFHIHNRVTAMI